MIGSDQFSRFWTAHLYNSKDEAGFPDEEPVYTDNTYTLYARRGHNAFATETAGIKFKRIILPDGTPVAANEYFSDPEMEEKNKYFIAVWSMVEFFTLANEKGQLLTTYCADVSNPEEIGFGYNISNLEDANYYGEEEAKHIRAICNQGYWGTESGFGSLEAFKQNLRESGQFTDDEIDHLTDGMAMNAMQCAIWTYSNAMNDMVFIGAHDVKYFRTPYGSITRTADAASHAADDDADLMMKLYRYLINLEPQEIPEEQITTENTIINEKNFLKSASLTITGKPENHANNKDADKTNDVYTVDLEIALKVKPIEENGDDLVLDIQDQNGNSIVKARIAGQIQDGEVPVTVISDGIYRIEGLELQEGETALRFTLSGTQNLKNDTFFFTSEIRDGEDSQPMVGIASGKRDVNIWMDISFELDVTDEELVREHVWRTEEFFVDIPVTKEWDDGNNQDRLRPESITVHLFADGTEIESATVEPDVNGNWSYTFNHHPKFNDDGQEIVYTVTEDPVTKYDTEINGYSIINHQLIDIPVTKTWDDDNDRDGVRPDRIVIHLFADGKEIDTATVTPDENGDWSYTFANLQKYRDGGVEIVYTVTEDAEDEYGTEIEGYGITNTHDPETREIEIRKVWDDADNQDGLRPESITVNLLADGETVQTVSVRPDENGDWSYTFTDLPKYRDGGIEIVYTVTEETVASYRTEINGFTITNRHVPGTVDIPVAKTWDDDDNRDGLRPDRITVNLLADGVIARSVEITPDEGGNWAYTFTDLPIYQDGIKIVYSIAEEPVAEYETDVTAFDILNTHEPETREIEIRKVWDDADNQDGLRPESITVNLLADGETVQTVSVRPDENGEWSYTFTGLPKYRDGGIEIVYTVTEDAVEAYMTEIDGYLLTNRHVPGAVDIKVEKIWVDSDNKYNSRPDSITVNLLADGEIIRTVTITPDKDGNWTHVFKDLPKYKGGAEVSYTVTEEPVSGYSSSVDGYRITNIYTPPTGDSFNPTLLFVLAGASLAALAAVIIIMRRRKPTK